MAEEEKKPEEKKPEIKPEDITAALKDYGGSKIVADKVVKIAAVQEAIKQWKSSGTDFPERYNSMAFTSWEEFNKFIKDDDCKRRIPAIDDILENIKESKKAFDYYVAKYKKDADYSKVKEDREKFLKNFDSNYSKVKVAIEEKEKELKTAQDAVRDYEAEKKKAEKNVRRANSNFGAFFRFMFAAASVAGLIALFLALPKAIGLSALFTGSFNSSLGTVFCMVAAGYGIKTLHGGIKKSADNKKKARKEKADGDMAKVNGKETVAQYQANKGKIIALENELKGLRSKKQEMENSVSYVQTPDLGCFLLDAEGRPFVAEQKAEEQDVEQPQPTETNNNGEPQKDDEESEIAKKIKGVEEKIAELEAKLGSGVSEDELKKLKDDLEKADAEKEELKRENSLLEDEKNSAFEKLSEAEQKAKDLKDENDSLNKTNSELNKALERDLESYYRNLDGDIY